MRHGIRDYRLKTGIEPRVSQGSRGIGGPTGPRSGCHGCVNPFPPRRQGQRRVGDESQATICLAGPERQVHRQFHQHRAWHAAARNAGGLENHGQHLRVALDSEGGFRAALGNLQSVDLVELVMEGQVRACATGDHQLWDAIQEGLADAAQDEGKKAAGDAKKKAAGALKDVKM